MDWACPGCGAKDEGGRHEMGPIACQACGKWWELEWDHLPDIGHVWWLTGKPAEETKVPA